MASPPVPTLCSMSLWSDFHSCGDTTSRIEASNLVLGIFGREDDFKARLGPDSVAQALDGATLKQFFLSILKENKVDERLISLAEGAVGRASQYIKFNCCSRPAADWFRCDADKPCVLIGDSLHSMPPTRGMGGNLALADGADLAKYLIENRDSARMDEFWGKLTTLQRDISDRGFNMVGSSLFWAKQYISGGGIFCTYKATGITGRAEMEADLRYGFQDNASKETIQNMFT